MAATQSPQYADRAMPLTSESVAARLPDAALALLAAFTGFVLFGFAVFALHPERIAAVPGAAEFSVTAFRLLPAAHIWIAAVALFAALAWRAGARWAPAFLAVYAISLTSELLGTGYGIPFGPYHYSPLLGVEWLGRVPIVIPLSWFAMAAPSYALARAALGKAARWWTVIPFGSLLLTAWDLSLDPAMSHATRYWVWGATGVYYGMPWSNLLGWFLTGVALMIALAALGADRWATRVPVRWMAAYYLVTLALPLGMCAAAGLWLAVAVSVLALGAAFAIAVRTGAYRRGMGVA
jgi:putative membrane protein